MTTMYEERQYMPRSTKRTIRTMFWLMLAVFVGGIVLLAKEGQLQQGWADWQKASTTVKSHFAGTQETSEGGK